ncbi:MAG: hypothetical protein JW984_15940 [Deltaproteobacteria bacterium]|uniref:Uncharacterized protein n=1 Tax=Candidatus Zymogenus saltonus TaxID=2844893 RepID=A0A9D8KHD2_9DELT|nr:hypothetical protein [Candidatus Zymogenus saltonus]
MTNGAQEKIAVYIDSMGKTPEQVEEFAKRLSVRFKLPMEKVLGFSKRLPARVGSYDLERAKKIGIEIRKMGGEVTLKRIKVVSDKGEPGGIPPKAKPAEPPRRPAPGVGGTESSWIVRDSALTEKERSGIEVAPPDESVSSWISRHDDAVSPAVGPAPPPPAEEEASWLSHGASETQSDLEDFSYAESKRKEEYQPQYDYRPEDVGTMPDDIGQKRKIGNVESKTTYTVDGSSSIEREAYNKASQLYAGRKAKSGILSGPIAKFVYLAVVIALGYYGYINRQYVLDYFIPPEKWVLEDAYMIKVKPDVLLPDDLTGKYIGKTLYKTGSGKTHVVEIELNVEGMSVKDLTLDISSKEDAFEQYRTFLYYVPGRITYLREVDYDVKYKIENKAFKSDGDDIAKINEKGRFRFSIVPMDIGINPADIPDSETDSLGSTTFLTIEGMYGDTNTFYGGLRSSTIELVGWEAKKK